MAQQRIVVGQHADAVILTHQIGQIQVGALLSHALPAPPGDGRRALWRGRWAGIRLEALSQLGRLQRRQSWWCPGWRPRCCGDCRFLTLPDSSGSGGVVASGDSALPRSSSGASWATADLQDAITLLVGKQLAAVRRFARPAALAHNLVETVDHHAAGQYGNASGLHR